MTNTRKAHMFYYAAVRMLEHEFTARETLAGALGPYTPAALRLRAVSMTYARVADSIGGLTFGRWLEGEDA